MNVALVLRRFSADGGTEKYVGDLARWLVGRGHDVHVYCAERRADAPGVTFHDLRPLVAKGLLGMLALERAAAAVALDAHDVVQGFGRTSHHHVWRAGGGCHAAWIAARDRYDAGRRHPIADRVETGIDRRAATSARIVVCNSEMAAGQISAIYGVPRERLRVVRNGVDLERFRPDPVRRDDVRRQWNVPDGGRVAVFLGHGFARKGLVTAAAAFERVAGARDRLVVVGRDAHAERFLAPLRRLGDRLVVAGPTSRPEDVLRSADAVLLPTRYDAAANTTVEALASGVPAITSAMDGNAEIAPDPALVVADPLDEEGFARALTYAWAAGPDLADRCRKVASQWPVSRNGEAMEALYREIAG